LPYSASSSSKKVTTYTNKNTPALRQGASAKHIKNLKKGGKKNGKLLFTPSVYQLKFSPAFH
jgi:hypothetical protein